MLAAARIDSETTYASFVPARLILLHRLANRILLRLRRNLLKVESKLVELAELEELKEMMFEEGRDCCLLASSGPEETGTLLGPLWTKAQGQIAWRWAYARSYRKPSSTLGRIRKYHYTGKAQKYPEVIDDMERSYRHAYKVLQHRLTDIDRLERLVVVKSRTKRARCLDLS